MTKKILATGFLLTSLCHARVITLREGQYSAVVDNAGLELKASVTGPLGKREWICRSVDLLADAKLSRQGVLVMTGESTADPVFLGFRYDRGKESNDCSMEMLDHPANKTGMGRLPGTHWDEYPGKDPLRRSHERPPLIRSYYPTLIGWDRHDNLRGIIRVAQHHWRKPIRRNIRYTWKLGTQSPLSDGLQQPEIRSLR